MNIKLVQVPGGVSTKEITIEGATIADVVEILGLKDREVRLNGEKVADDAEVSDGDVISAAGRIKGA